MSALPYAVIIPLINPNEPEALIAFRSVKAGEQVAKDDLLSTLETTKAAADVSAEVAGYVIGLGFSAGQTIQAGDILCYLAERPDLEPPQASLTQATSLAEQPTPGAKPGMPAGLRITQPALNLARQARLNLEVSPSG